MSGILQLVNTFPSGGFAVKNSLRFRSSASAYLSRTPASAGNRRTWTWSGWCKRGALGTDQYFFGVRNGISDTDAFYLAFFSDNTFVVSSNSTPIPYLVTSQLFRDPSAWYHIVVAVDTTQVTSTNRIKVYVNGAQITSFSTATYPSQNANLGINQAYQHVIGAWYNGSSYIAPFDGYMAEVNFIDGQALTPTSFGAFDATSGVWQPTRYSGTYGTNGFYLKFSDTTSTTTLCYDYSGNGNNWTPNNISLTAGSTYDSMLDSPTNYDNGGNGVGNYAVLNPLLNSGGTITNGNLSLTGPAVSLVRALSISVSSGIWYVEASISWDNAQTYTQFGILQSSQIYASGYLSQLSTSYGVTVTPSYSNYATFQGSTATQWGAKASSGTAIAQLAFDASSGKIWFGINGSWLGGGNPATGTSPTYSSVPSANWFFCFSVGSDASNTAYVNCGQRPFAYTPPTGYKALNTQNLSAPSIVNGAAYMAATLWTGDGASPKSFVNTVNGVSFQPDLVWIKMRSGAYQHVIADSVRGGNAILHSNSTSAEEVNWQYGYLQSFNSNGFTAQAGSTSIENINLNGSTFVGWQWKAGGTAVTNTAGSITSSVSANTTAGFSVVTYTGNGAVSTVGHGLGVAPNMVIYKKRNNTASWGVYHSSLGAGGVVFLDLTLAFTANTGYFNNTAPNTTVLTVGAGTSFCNDSGATYVAYCFAAIPGYSAFGSYTGNGSSDGPFIFLGFRPRFIMYKRTDSAADWVILDSTRDAYNQQSLYLLPDSSSAELDYTSLYPMDFVSNGWKIRQNASGANASGGTYVYAAFAENPFKFSLAR